MASEASKIQHLIYVQNAIKIWLAKSCFTGCFQCQFECPTCKWNDSYVRLLVTYSGYDSGSGWSYSFGSHNCPWSIGSLISQGGKNGRWRKRSVEFYLLSRNWGDSHSTNANGVFGPRLESSGTKLDVGARVNLRQKGKNAFIDFERILSLSPASPHCLKISEKVSFNMASEASCVYILNGQKFINNGQKWSILAKLAVK